MTADIFIFWLTIKDEIKPSLQYFWISGLSVFSFLNNKFGHNVCFNVGATKNVLSRHNHMYFKNIFRIKSIEQLEFYVQTFWSSLHINIALKAKLNIRDFCFYMSKSKINRCFEKNNESIKTNWSKY